MSALGIEIAPKQSASVLLADYFLLRMDITHWAQNKQLWTLARITPPVLELSLNRRNLTRDEERMIMSALIASTQILYEI